MKILKNDCIFIGLVTAIFLLAACDSNQSQQATVAIDPAKSESTPQSDVNNIPSNNTRAAFAILTTSTGEIDVLVKPISAPADMSFKNSCKTNARAIGLSDINFGDKLYCSDAASRTIEVMDLNTGAALFTWAWPADVSSTSQWLIGRWHVGSDIGLAAYDSSTGVFQIFNQGDKAFDLNHSFEYGGVDKSLLPLVGDWNGDGTDTVGIYKQATQQMDLRNSLDAGIADISLRFVDGSIDASSQPVVVNTATGSAAAMYSIEQGSVTLGSIDLTKQPQTVFLFGAAGVAKNALPIR